MFDSSYFFFFYELITFFSYIEFFTWYFMIYNSISFYRSKWPKSQTQLVSQSVTEVNNFMFSTTDRPLKNETHSFNVVQLKLILWKEIKKVDFLLLENYMLNYKFVFCGTKMLYISITNKTIIISKNRTLLFSFCHLIYSIFTW